MLKGLSDSLLSWLSEDFASLPKTSNLRTHVLVDNRRVNLLEEAWELRVSSFMPDEGKKGKPLAQTPAGLRRFTAAPSQAQLEPQMTGAY
jgi:hypothetical protein